MEDYLIQITLQHYSYSEQTYVQTKEHFDKRIKLTQFRKILFDNFTTLELRKHIGLATFLDFCYLIKGQQKQRFSDLELSSTIENYGLSDPGTVVEFICDLDVVEVRVPSINRTKKFFVSPGMLLPMFLDVLEQEFKEDFKKQQIHSSNIINLLTICYKNNEKVRLVEKIQDNDLICINELSILKNKAYFELIFNFEYLWQKAIIRHEIQIINPQNGKKKCLKARIDSGCNATLAVKCQIADELGLVSYGNINVQGLDNLVQLKSYLQQVQIYYKDDFGTEIQTFIPVIELKSDTEEALLGLYGMELIAMEIDVQKKSIYANKQLLQEKQF